MNKKTLETILDIDPCIGKVLILTNDNELEEGSAKIRIHFKKGRFTMANPLNIPITKRSFMRIVRNAEIEDGIQKEIEQVITISNKGRFQYFSKKVLEEIITNLMKFKNG